MSQLQQIISRITRWWIFLVNLPPVNCQPLKESICVIYAELFIFDNKLFHHRKIRPNWTQLQWQQLALKVQHIIQLSLVNILGYWFLKAYKLSPLRFVLLLRKRRNCITLKAQTIQMDSNAIPQKALYIFKFVFIYLTYLTKLLQVQGGQLFFVLKYRTI